MFALKCNKIPTTILKRCLHATKVLWEYGVPINITENLLVPMKQDCDVKKKKKISIIGAAGKTGSLMAYDTFIKNYAEELVLINRTKEKVIGEGLDLKHGSSWQHSPFVQYSNELTAAADSDLIIINSGAPRKANVSRLELVKNNVEVFKTIIPPLAKCSPDAVMLIVSNPVDIISYATWKLSGFPKNRIVGTGTEIDCARFRYLLGQKLEINAKNVDAWIIGEHGDSCVACWSSVNIGGIRLRDLDPNAGTVSDQNGWKEIHEQVIKTGNQLIELKGYSAAGIILSAENIARSIISNSNQIHACSTSATGIYGIKSDCFLSLPCVVGNRGIKYIVQQRLSEDEIRKLHQSADMLDKILKETNF